MTTEPTETEFDDPETELIVYEDNLLHGEEPRRDNKLWLGVLLGSIVGFSVSFGASWYLLKPTPIDLSEIQSRLTDVETRITTIAAQPAPSVPDIDLSPLQSRIAALEARPTVDPLNAEIVDRLEALQADGFELPEMPEIPDVSLIEDRLQALEARTDEVATSLKTLREAPTLVEPVETETAVDPETLPSFPETIIRDGAAERVGGGFVRRTFSRHVRIQGDDNPQILVDGIVADMKAGKPRAALAKFDRLPPELQSLARAWRANMEDILK